MSDIAIPGYSADSNSAKQIENLLKAKRIPLDRLEIKKEEYDDSKVVWQDVNVTLSKLSDSANQLFGFENPFTEKNVISSNESILTAETERNAIDENLTFKVDRIATSDKFVSYQIDSEQKVPRGSYTFKVGENETTLKYRGGDYEDFVSKLNRKDPDNLKASLVKNSSKTQVVLIESLKTGEENRLEFLEDSIDLGLDIGLIQKNNIENNQISVNDLISSSGRVDKSKYELTLSPVSKASFRVDSEINENDIFELTFELLNTPGGEESSKSLLDDLVAPSIQVEDIIIDNEKGDTLDRFEEDSSSANKEPVLDMNVLTVSDSEYTIKVDPLVNQNNKKQILTFSGKQIKELKSINITNNNSDKTLKLHSVIQKKGAGDGEYIPVNPVTVAKNAKIYMNGMEIERETNEIDDLVEGTKLFLHGADPDEDVTLNIDFDTEYARDKILEFVYNYNEVMHKIVLLTNNDSAVLSEIEFADDAAKEQAEKIQGTLQGDRTLNNIKQSLQRSITTVYPTEESGDYSLLSAIGISTNAGGGTGGVNMAKLRGYIEADVEQLESSLKNNITAVKNLFGFDTNSDFIIDSGIGKNIVDILRPYTRTGGIIATRITTIDSQIDRTEKEISDYQDDLVTYEDTIRRKYGQMDATINSLNSSLQSIQNLTNNGGD